jgi:BMFP domain-containing protein YqiC
MINAANLESLTERITAALPPQLAALSEDVRALVRDLVKEQLLKLDLVPREEFDIQCAVLKRLETKLAELEKLFAQLEETIARKS